MAFWMLPIVNRVPRESAAAPKFGLAVSESLKRLDSMPGFVAEVSTRTTAQAISASSHTTISWRRPDLLSIHVRTSSGEGHGAIDWRYEWSRGKLVGYDRRHDTVVRRSLDTGPIRLGNINEVLQILPDAVTVVLDPTRYRSFFTPLLAVSGWKRAPVAGATGWTHSAPNGSFFVSFDSRTRLLRSVTIRTKETKLEWKFIITPYHRQVPLVIPKSATPVSAFILPSQPPSYGNPVVQTMVARCFDAYDELRDSRVEVVTNSKEATVLIARGGVRQTNQTADWAWQAGVLTAYVPGTHRFYKGEMKRSAIPGWLSKRGVALEPIAQAWLSGTNFASKPFNGLGIVFTPPNPITKRDAVLDISQAPIFSKVTVNPEGLITRWTVRSYSGGGRLLSSTDSRYTYRSIAGSNQMLTVPAHGQATTPLGTAKLPIAKPTR